MSSRALCEPYVSEPALSKVVQCGKWMRAAEKNIFSLIAMTAVGANSVRQVLDFIDGKYCLRIQQIIESRIPSGFAACQEGFINNFIHSCCGYL